MNTQLVFVWRNRLVIKTPSQMSQEHPTMTFLIGRLSQKRSFIAGVVLFTVLLPTFILYSRGVSSVVHRVNNPKTSDIMIITTTKNPRPPTSLLKPEADFVVPNVVHYVWIGDYEPLKFHHMLSIKSVYLHIKPDRIMFHCTMEPTGKWWKHVKRSISTLRVVKFRPPSEIFGNQVMLPEHQSDVARIEILMEKGGIYIDTDVIALKSFDPLRRYNMTMGLEYHGQPGRLNNGVIVARKNAAFLSLWYDTYRNFTKREWDFHDSIIPYYLQYNHPRLIHVEEGTINSPSGKDRHLIYEGLYDWSENYAMHLWHRLHTFEHTQNDIKGMNTTFGQIARFIYYGSPEMINT